MNYIILDLEWNGAFSKKEHKFVNEIIEFGAVKLNSALSVTDRFSMLVTPQIGKKLSGKISELTKITNEDLKTAHNTFMHVASLFGKFSADSVILTWGQSDIRALMDNFEYYNKDTHIGFLKQYCDLQIYCAKMLGIYDKSKQMGLSSCAEMLNIDTDIFKLHRAQDDAELSALCFRQLYSEENFPKYIELCDEEFYRKVTFKNTCITDLKSPLIDKSEMHFKCPDCGTETNRTTAWTVKNKHFRADFRCPKCGLVFSGRITFRLKYDGMQISKRITIKKSDDESKQNSE